MFQICRAFLTNQLIVTRHQLENFAFVVTTRSINTLKIVLRGSAPWPNKWQVKVSSHFHYYINVDLFGFKISVLPL